MVGASLCCTQDPGRCLIKTGYTGRAVCRWLLGSQAIVEALGGDGGGGLPAVLAAQILVPQWKNNLQKGHVAVQPFYQWSNAFPPAATA